MLLDYCDGIIKAVGLVKYMRYAQRDGLNICMVEKIARCGGLHYENASRNVKDLLRSCGSEDFVTNLNGSYFKWGVLPSNVIKLIGRTPGQFQKRLAPSADDVELFWTEFFSSETGMDYKSMHPFLKHATAKQLRNKFPMRVHQDSGPFTKNSSVDCISWSSVLGVGSELEVKYGVVKSSRCMYHQCMSKSIETDQQTNESVSQFNTACEHEI